MDFKDFLARNKVNKVNLNEGFNNNCSLAEAMGHNQKFWSYVINPVDYKIAYISPNILFDLPEVKVGDICFSHIMGLNEPCESCPLKFFEESCFAELWIERLGAYFNIRAEKVSWVNKEELTIMRCYKCSRV